MPISRSGSNTKLHFHLVYNSIQSALYCFLGMCVRLEMNNVYPNSDIYRILTQRSDSDFGTQSLRVALVHFHLRGNIFREQSVCMK